MTIQIKDAKMILESELKTRSSAYYDYLQAGGKGDCAEEASLDALELAMNALERESIYKSTLFKISETLVDESKLHITPEKACEQILEYLKQQDVKLWKLKEVKE